jgi:cache domain-containing protein
MGSNMTVLASYAAAVIVAIGILSCTGLAQIQALESHIKSDAEARISSVAFDTSKRMSDIASIMKVTAKLPQVKDISDAHLITAENKGVPENAAVEKRKIARDILASNNDIDAIAFMLANGDRYAEEPYLRQLNLTRTNFASRDYFQGAVASGEAYIGEVYISAASKASAAALVVPVYSDDDNKTLVGVWMAVMNLQELNDRASEMLGSEYGGRIVYIDQNSHEVVSSSELVSAEETLSDLQSYAEAEAGKSGSRPETKDGTQMYVVYSPIHMPGTT